MPVRMTSDKIHLQTASHACMTEVTKSVMSKDRGLPEDVVKLPSTFEIETAPQTPIRFNLSPARQTEIQHVQNRVLKSS